jgi:hypothetical protein
MNNTPGVMLINVSLNDGVHALTLVISFEMRIDATMRIMMIIS